MKEKLKKIIKLSIFLIIASLPFLTITQIIGMETFLDSFEHPESYICLEDNGKWLGTKTKEGGYIIIQRSSHPDFTIKDSDTVIYCKNNGEIACNQIKEKEYYMNSIKRYRAIDNNEPNEEIIYENQIIGKVIKTIDDNLWNTLSIKLWEISIYNLNIKAIE